MDRKLIKYLALPICLLLLAACSSKSETTELQPGTCSKDQQVLVSDHISGQNRALEKSDFKNVECKREDHITPAGAVQNFVFCSFMKQLAQSNLQEA